MSEQDNLNIVRRLIDGFNSHNLDMTVQYVADNAKSYIPALSQTLDKEQTSLFNQNYLRAFPDLHFDVKDWIAQGDKVAVTWVARGTFQGPLNLPTGDSLPPTNRSIQEPGVTIYELHNGMVTRQDIYWDQVSFLTQVGVITPEMLASMMRR